MQLPKWTINCETVQIVRIFFGKKKKILMPEVRKMPVQFKTNLNLLNL